MIRVRGVTMLGQAGRDLAAAALEAGIARGDYPDGLVERLILDRAIAFEERARPPYQDPFQAEPAAIRKLRQVSAGLEMPQAVSRENTADAANSSGSGARIAALGVRLRGWISAERTALEAAIASLDPVEAGIAPIVPATLSALALVPLGTTPERAADLLTAFNRGLAERPRPEACQLLRSLQTEALRRAGTIRDIDDLEGAEEAALAWAAALGRVTGRI